ncbi:hypothetical protein PybrP1_010425 [[Pythium] brassicae (nom. inval.)]|nr:hypothetical protein PybrP1_010425 [[Pythium] brassicae (nom. inval.)]
MARLQRGLPLLLSAGRRAFERRAELNAYHAQQLFGPLSYWNAAAQFLRLQMPQRTHVDLREFLDGAAFAGTQHQLAANSLAFAKFTLSSQNASAVEAGEKEEQQVAPDSEELLALCATVDDATSAATAEQLEAICSPRMFTGLVDARRRALREGNLLIEIQELKIDTIAVERILYMQFTESDYADLVHGRRSLTALSSPDATSEHLFIQVSAQTTEIHKMTLVGQEVALVEQQNRRTWAFESDATDPDSLDWRILDDYGINVSARELEARRHLKGSGPSDGATA